MQEVKIYIETSIQGPCVKDGWYAAIMECETKKGPAQAGFVDMEKDTTYHRSTLLAAVKALQRLKPCKVTIYTNSSFVANMTKQKKPEAWQRCEWKNSKGRDVEHKDLWQQYIDEEKRHHKIEFRFSKYNDYRQKLQEMIRKGASGNG